MYYTAWGHCAASQKKNEEVWIMEAKAEEHKFPRFPVVLQFEFTI